MVKDDVDKTVPSFFRCPISLEVMKLPVSLCTGVTYDRASIQRWLDDGNNTCPVTMQVLHTKDFVPNHTLQRLIQIWFSNSRSHSQSESDSPLIRSITQEQAQHLIQQLKNHLSNRKINYLDHIRLSKLLLFANDSDENLTFLATNEEFVVTLGEILGDENLVSKNLSIAEKVVRLCHLILEQSRDKQQIAKQVIEKKCLISMEFLLKSGSLESRIATAKFLELISADIKTKLAIAEHNEILLALLRLVKSQSNPDLIEVGLSCLICLSMPKRTRAKLIHLGAVSLLGKTLLDSDLTVPAVEKTLKLLEMMSSCKEGRDCICGDEFCVPAILKKVLKVSSEATEHSVTILWCLCCLFHDQKAREAVIKSNGLAKVLLLMQSNCSPAVRQMSSDLLKIFSINSKCYLSSYDTKTTHIMPF